MSAEMKPQAVPGTPPAPGSSTGGGSVLPKLLFFLGLIAIGVGILYFLRVNQAKKADQSAIPTVVKTAKTSRGTIEMRLRVTGQTSARNYANMVAPKLRGPDSNQAMLLLSIKDSGTFVRKGDVVAEFDPQSMKDLLDDAQANLKDRENDLKKRKVEQELDMVNLQQSLREAKATVDKAKYDMKAHDIRTEIDQEILRLSVEEAEATYKEMQQDLPQKVASQKADFRILEITRQQDALRVQRAQENLEKLVLRAPMDGMVVLQQMPRPGGDVVTIAVGDRINPGQPFMKIIDPKTMQLEANINQAESSMFRLGQPAAVGLDAFPGAGYEGKVYAIGALAVSQGRAAGYYIRSVPIRVAVGNPDKKMIPDLSASADVLLERASDVVIAPSSALEESDGKSFVYVQGPAGFEKRPVKVGLNNGTQIAVLEGVKEGEVVQVN